MRACIRINSPMRGIKRNDIKGLMDNIIRENGIGNSRI